MTPRFLILDFRSGFCRSVFKSIPKVYLAQTRLRVGKVIYKQRLDKRSAGKGSNEKFIVQRTEY